MRQNRTERNELWKNYLRSFLKSEPSQIPRWPLQKWGKELKTFCSQLTRSLSTWEVGFDRAASVLIFGMKQHPRPMPALTHSQTTSKVVKGSKRRRPLRPHQTESGTNKCFITILENWFVKRLMHLSDFSVVLVLNKIQSCYPSEEHE